MDLAAFLFFFWGGSSFYKRMRSLKHEVATSSYENLIHFVSDLEVAI